MNGEWGKSLPADHGHDRTELPLPDTNPSIARDVSGSYNPPLAKDPYTGEMVALGKGNTAHVGKKVIEIVGQSYHTHDETLRFHVDDLSDERRRQSAENLARSLEHPASDFLD